MLSRIRNSFSGYYELEDFEKLAPNPIETQSIVTQTRNNESTLSKNWVVLFPSVFVIYAVLQMAVLGSKVCMYENDAHINFPRWTHQINLFVVIWFAVNIAWTSYMLFLERKSKYAEKIAPLVANLTILGIAGSSSFLTLNFHWGGVCRDYFGVISPASQWPEWVTSVPLLFYSAISCDISRPSLDLTDVLIISSMGLTISTGFVLNISHFPAWVYHSMLFISCSAVSSVVLLAVFTNKQLVKQIHCAKSLHALEDETSCMTPRERFHRVEIQFKRLQYAMKKKKLAMVCLVGMPLFPIIYFLSAQKIIEDSVSYSGFMIAGMVTKSVIATILASSHMNSYDDIEYCVAMSNLKNELSKSVSFVKFAENRYYKMNFTSLP